MVPTYEATRAGYAAMWAKATVPDSERAAAAKVAARIIAHRTTYEDVEHATGVPWFFVGCLHDRESGGNFNTHLHNGDLLSGYTHQKPPGRPQVGHGPPFTWMESAIDALKMRGLDKISDWSLPRILYEAEAYNGFGYVGRGVNSPYLWACTSLQQRGKYVGDGEWSSMAIDSQLGVVAVLKELAALDPTIAARLTTASPTPKESKPVTTTTPATTITDPIPQIISMLETAQKFLPMFAGFLPPPLGPAITVAIPIIEEILQAIEDAKTKGGVDLIQSIGAHIQTIGQHVQTVATTVAAPVAPTAIAQQAGGQ